MNNRKRIEKFCKENNIEIISIEFIHNSEPIYGDCTDCPYWEVYGYYHDLEICFDSMDLADTVDEAVTIMFSDVLEDINSEDRNFFTGGKKTDAVE